MITLKSEAENTAEARRPVLPVLVREMRSLTTVEAPLARPLVMASFTVLAVLAFVPPVVVPLMTLTVELVCVLGAIVVVNELTAPGGGMGVMMGAPVVALKVRSVPELDEVDVVVIPPVLVVVVEPVVLGFVVSLFVPLVVVAPVVRLVELLLLALVTPAVLLPLLVPRPLLREKVLLIPPTPNCMRSSEAQLTPMFLMSRSVTSMNLDSIITCAVALSRSSMVARMRVMREGRSVMTRALLRVSMTILPPLAVSTRPSIVGLMSTALALLRMMTSVVVGSSRSVSLLMILMMLPSST